MPNFKITARTLGGLFQGKPEAVMSAYALAAKEAVAQEAVDLVHIHLDRVLQNPTGYYRSKVAHNLVSRTEMVHDSGVIYGGWLEGVSSRNITTRFKGYHTFRLVAQDIRKIAPEIARRVLPPYIGRLN